MARILLVDDNYDILNQCKIVLSMLNHDILTVTDGYDALGILNTHAIDVAVIDISMPYLNGYELIRRIKRNPQLKNIEIAVLTSRQDPTDVARCMDMGVQRYLNKPVDVKTYLTAIRSLIPQWPDSRKNEINFAQHTNALVTVELESEILTMSELGIVITTANQLHLNQTIKISSTIFEEIGLGKTAYFLVDCINPNGDNWVARLLFKDLFASERQKINNYIEQMNLKNH